MDNIFAAKIVLIPWQNPLIPIFVSANHSFKEWTYLISEKTLLQESVNLSLCLIGSDGILFLSLCSNKCHVLIVMAWNQFLGWGYGTIFVCIRSFSLQCKLNYSGVMLEKRQWGGCWVGQLCCLFKPLANYICKMAIVILLSS